MPPTPTTPTAVSIGLSGITARHVQTERTSLPGLAIPTGDGRHLMVGAESGRVWRIEMEGVRRAVDAADREYEAHARKEQ